MKTQARWLSGVSKDNFKSNHLLPDDPNRNEINYDFAKARAQEAFRNRQLSPKPPSKNTLIALSSGTNKQLSDLLRDEFKVLSDLLENLSCKGKRWVEVTIDFTQAPMNSSYVVTAKLNPLTAELTTTTSKKVKLVADLKNKQPGVIYHYGPADKSPQMDDHVKVTVFFDKNFNAWKVVKI